MVTHGKGRVLGYCKAMFDGDFVVLRDGSGIETPQTCESG